MVGAEVNLVIEDSLKAVELYKQIFDIEVIEASSKRRK